jgi:RNA polymerase sigma-70 factor, ECF subfamily
MDERTSRRLLDLLAPIHDRARETARRLEARTGEGEDLFHEAVLKACEKLSTLRDLEKFPMWFYRILLNTHRGRARRAFWKRFVRLDADPAPPAAPVAGDEAEARFHRAERLARALATLPAVQREAVVLAEIQGYPLDEIAAMQRVTVSAVKSRVARGRERLRRHYSRVLGLGAAAAAPDAAPPGLDREERSPA